MDVSSKIIPCVKPHFPKLVEIIHAAEREFSQAISTAFQAHWLDGKAKLMSLSVGRLLKEKFGTDPSKPTRVRNWGKVPVLIIEGDGFDVGIRFKKLSPDNISYQHRSKAQDKVRQKGTYPTIPGMESLTYHVFIGCRFTKKDLVPQLIDIVLTSERQRTNGMKYTEFKYPIWDSRLGMEPIRPETLTIPFPTRTSITPKKQYGIRAKKNQGDKDVKPQTGTDATGG